MLVLVLAAIAIWCTIGMLVAAPYLLVGVGRVGEGARGSSVAFRLLIPPATVLLWPIVLRRWTAAYRGAPHA